MTFQKPTRRYQNVYKGTILEGPYFRTDAGKAVKKQINKLITGLLRQGVREVKSDLRKGQGKDSGAYRRSIRSKKRGLTGRIYSRQGGAISSWLQGESRLNSTARYKGFRLWTTARDRLDRDSGRETRENISRLVRDLGGF